MATEVWFRNPELYIRECVELMATNLAWDRGYLVGRKIDPTKLVELYFPAGTEYRQLLVGEQGTAELRPGHTLSNPVAVYPTWEYGIDEFDVLVEMLENPIGQDAAACSDKNVQVDERPVFGQEHRVVIIRPPEAGSGIGKKFFRLLKELQEEFPEAIIHLHGPYSYRVLFGFGYRSVDVDPRFTAKKGNVYLPSGKRVAFEDALRTPQWVSVVGFSPTDLKVPRNRCMFNMKSAWWAAENYRDNLRFKTRGQVDVDPDAITHTAATTSAVSSQPAVATVGDKLVCDSCSLQVSCKYFRAGGVCSIPGSEPAPLAHFFKTRDADTVINGLGTLLAAESRRLERGIRDEEDFGEISPEVTKIFEGLFDRGVKLAKLLNPNLEGKPKFQANFQFGPQPSGAGPQQMMSQVVAELEAKGIDRKDITPEMITALLEGPPDVIDVEVDDHEG